MQKTKGLKSLKEAINSNPNLQPEIQAEIASTISRERDLKAIVENLPVRYRNYGFNGLIETTKNKKFISICKEYFKYEHPKKSLILCGNVGSGKTRLAVATLRNMRRIRNGEQAVYPQRAAKSIFIVADEFFQMCNDAATDRKSKLQIIENLLSYDICCIDDLSIENFSPAKQENFYLLINRVYIDCKRIILTTNFLMEDLEKIDPRMTDRLRDIASIMKFEGSSFRGNQTVKS